MINSKEKVMSDFENNITTLCKKLGVDFSSQVSANKRTKNSVFNPALKKVVQIEHKPATAQINPLSLPFIR
ncbi:MAG: hypothetical protein ACI92O_000423 [Colwellia sp.]